MKIETYTLTKLEAEEGKYLTNGKTIGTFAHLGINDSPANWREITEEEKEQLEKEMSDCQDSTDLEEMN